MKQLFLSSLHKYLIFSTPVVLLAIIIEQYWPTILPIQSIGDNLISTLFGILFFLWLISLFIFLIRIALQSEYRTLCFKQVAGLHERDEREELIVGKAAKSSFLFMLSILLILFFSSTWRYGENKNPGPSARSITLGHIDLIEKSPTQDKTSETIYYSIPISNTALLLFLIVTQLISFRLFSYHEQRNA